MWHVHILHCAKQKHIDTSRKVEFSIEVEYRLWAHDMNIISETCRVCVGR